MRSRHFLIAASAALAAAPQPASALDPFSACQAAYSNAKAPRAFEPHPGALSFLRGDFARHGRGPGTPLYIALSEVAAIAARDATRDEVGAKGGASISVGKMECSREMSARPVSIVGPDGESAEFAWALAQDGVLHPTHPEHRAAVAAPSPPEPKGGQSAAVAAALAALTKAQAEGSDPAKAAEAAAGALRSAADAEAKANAPVGGIIAHPIGRKVLCGPDCSADISPHFRAANGGAIVGFEAALASGSPLPGWLAFDGKIGVFSARPGASVAGNYPVRVAATDAAGLSASQVFILEAAAAPDPEAAAPGKKDEPAQPRAAKPPEPGAEETAIRQLAALAARAAADLRAKQAAPEPQKPAPAPAEEPAKAIAAGAAISAMAQREQPPAKPPETAKAPEQPASAPGAAPEPPKEEPKPFRWGEDASPPPPAPAVAPDAPSLAAARAMPPPPAAPVDERQPDNGNVPAFIILMLAAAAALFQGPIRDFIRSRRQK